MKYEKANEHLENLSAIFASREESREMLKWRNVQLVKERYITHKSSASPGNLQTPEI